MVQMKQENGLKSEKHWEDNEAEKTDRKGFSSGWTHISLKGGDADTFQEVGRRIS